MNRIELILMTIFCTVLMAQCTSPVQETPERFSIVEKQLEIWDIGAQQVLDIAAAMPEDKMNYRPHDSLMTFAQQLIHIGQSSEFITNAFLKDIPRPKNRQRINADSMSKAEVIAYVKEKLQVARNNMEGMSNKQLTTEEVTSFVGNKMYRLEGLLLAHDHLTNHRAKANLYLRLVNIKPPKWRYY